MDHARRIAPHDPVVLDVGEVDVFRRGMPGRSLGEGNFALDLQAGVVDFLGGGVNRKLIG